MRVSLTVLALLVAGVASAAESSDFSWFDEHGGVLWSADLSSGERPDASGEPILARPWFKPLEELTFERLDGGDPLTTADLLGHVVVLDFWASWCGPCRYELPRMQAFHRSRADRGLITLAINLQEQPELALASAADFGLELPVVPYGRGFNDAFDIRKIPTIVVVDRLGRVRGRWELFNEDVEQRIYDTIDELLDPGDAALQPIAARLSGRYSFDVRWMREFPVQVDAGRLLPGTGQSSRVLVSAGRRMHVLHADGRTDQLVDGSHSSGRLLALRAGPEDGFQVLAYRLGGTKLSRFELPSGTRTEIDTPAPLLDAAWVDPADPGAGALLATMHGLVSLDAEGATGEAVDIGLVRGLGRAAAGAAAWVALTGSEERRWRRLSADLETLEERAVEGDPWRLEGFGRNGLGVLGTRVKGVAAGSFFAAHGSDQVALATADELVVLDSADGTELFRARWPGIETLSAADTDGDGRDELLVTWGQRVAVLECVSDCARSAKKEDQN